MSKISSKALVDTDHLLASNTTESRIIPPPPKVPTDEIESLSVWGFNDSGFSFNQQGQATFLGSKYTISGQEMPALRSWMSARLEVEVRHDDIHLSHYPTRVAAPLTHSEFEQSVRDIFSTEQLSQESAIRLRHGHGHTQQEMYNIKYAEIKRVPDLVVYPEEEEQIRELVSAALKYNAVLIPYGGGTSVTQALACSEHETRFIVSVDMQRMRRILWIDPVNRMACIQAGAVGRHIVRQLEEYGFTMGHEPDSIEFSTLGGWIATNASGMKKNKYGNIEDLVLDMNVVTATGELQRSAVLPRESVGSDPRQALFGSEGNLGIISSATVKLFDLPEKKHYGSILFASFEQGTAFMYELANSGNTPASVRLVDNVQFQFSMSLKPLSTGAKALKKRFETFIVTQLKGFEPDKMVVCTLVFEGSQCEVKAQEKHLYEIAQRYGGMKAGAENGQKGYELTFAIAYLRDWAMNHYVLGESFETSVSWSQLLSLCERVKARVYKEHTALGFPGKPFITCRVTQLYSTGACVYFYLGVAYKGVDNPTERFNQLEHAAREEILQAGGSLSHHHGIGKLRQSFVPDIMSEAMIAWNQSIKKAVDPSNVFAAGNLFSHAAQSTSQSTESNT